MSKPANNHAGIAQRESAGRPVRRSQVSSPAPRSKPLASRKRDAGTVPGPHHTPGTLRARRSKLNELWSLYTEMNGCLAAVSDPYGNDIGIAKANAQRLALAWNTLTAMASALRPFAAISFPANAADQYALFLAPMGRDAIRVKHVRAARAALAKIIDDCWTRRKP